MWATIKGSTETSAALSPRSSLFSFVKIQDSMYCETEIQILINGFHANIVYSNMLKMKHDMINFIQ